MSIEDLFSGGMPGGNAGPGGFGDMLGDLFSSGRGPRRGGPAKGNDLTSEVNVDFVSAIRGAELRLQVQDGGDPVTIAAPDSPIAREFFAIAGRLAQKLAIAEHRALPVLQ